MREFMARFGVLDMKDSADKILDVINTQVKLPHSSAGFDQEGPPDRRPFQSSAAAPAGSLIHLVQCS